MSGKTDKGLSLDVPSLGLGAALTIFRSVIWGKGATYVATPLTTGREFYNHKHHLSESHSHAELRLRRIMLRNKERVRPVIKRLRQQLMEPLIDPTQVKVDDWTQQHYRILWQHVIEQLVTKIVFLDGWEYSTGCIYEFLVGCSEHVSMLDELLEPLTPIAGKKLIESAWNDLRQAGHDSAAHREAVQQLAIGPRG